MAKAPAEQALRPKHLRVALVWNGTMQAEDLLDAPRVVRVGSTADCVYPLPADVATTETLTVLEPTESSYRLRITPEMRGDVWLRGQRRSVSDLRAEEPIALSPDDFGVVSVGAVSLFFQQVRASERMPRRFFNFDAATAASLGLVAFLTVAFLLVLFLIIRPEMPEPDPFELSTDLVARFMVTPPPESILETMRDSGTETKDPGKQDRDDAGGKAAEKEEGRVGKRDAKVEQTEIAGERKDVVAARVRNMGLLGALSGGGESNAIAEALDVPDVSDVLGGLGSAQTILGRGAGGAGLRGVGEGGGGTGPGSLFGAGGLNTGVGAGSGRGLGKGKGGIGAAGRERKERAISVQTGTPKVNGYLSMEQINRVVRANQGNIKYCYEVELQRQPALKGRVELQWRVDLQGLVTSPRVASSTLHNARVEGCMVRQLRNWRFPKPDGGEVVVLYPFLFGMGN
ncbi:MAG: AgmX/PglI C-terminal domain-containing protein [Polyangiales bacterium]|nr:AgmX/PglI C-terminal domain-containing protein [Myxococcales bacterium]